ncbi:MAG: phosphoribosylaminoimidazolecarboxamide formyltransferase [Candidatus Parcubacteria bacterium]
MTTFDGKIRGPNPHQEAHAAGTSSVDFAAHVRPEQISVGVLKNIEAAQVTLYALRQREPLCVVIKHKNACAATLGGTPLEALMKTIDSTPATQSGVVAINTTCTAIMAEQLIEKLPSVAAILAHNYDPEALTLLASKKIIVCTNKPFTPSKIQTTEVLGLQVKHSTDTTDITEHELHTHTKQKPDEAAIADLTLGMNLVRVLESNAIAIVANGAVIAIGKSTESRTDAIHEALRKVQLYKKRHPDQVIDAYTLSSDASISESDFTLITASNQPIRHIAVPFEAKTTPAITTRADRNGMSLSTLPTRHLST